MFGLVLWWVSRSRRAYQASSTSSRERAAPGRQEAPEEDPYQILDVQRDASKQEIKAAYKKLAAQYHPDRVQHLGKEFQELANRKFVAIQRAYETLRR